MFQERKFRDKVTTGMFTLPAVAGLTALLWMLPDIGDEARWKGLLVAGATAYLLVELNNRNALLRIRSRMVSTVYLSLMAACPFLHPWSPDLVPAACLVAAYFPLFAAYQRPQASGEVFHAFLLVAAGSLLHPPLLFLLPVFYISLAIQLRALCWRTFAAGLLGAALPYWLYAAYALWQHRLGEALADFAAAFHPQQPDYTAIGLPQAVSAGFVGLLLLMAVGHFLRTAFGDKIRIRMYFYTIILQEVLLLAATALQPQRFDLYFHLLIANGAPLIAHYFTLARGRRMNAWFICWLLLLAALLLFNNFHAWIPSSIF